MGIHTGEAGVFIWDRYMHRIEIFQSRDVCNFSGELSYACQTGIFNWYDDINFLQEVFYDLL